MLQLLQGHRLHSQHRSTLNQSKPVSLVTGISAQQQPACYNTAANGVRSMDMPMEHNEEQEAGKKAEVPAWVEWMSAGLVVVVGIAILVAVFMLGGAFGAPRYTSSCPADWAKEDCPQ